MQRKLTEFFMHPRYKINKTLLSINGQWPFQGKNEKILLFAVSLFFTITGLPAQIRQVYFYRGNWAEIIPAMGPIIVHVGCTIKLINSHYNEDKMRLLLERVYDDWQVPMGPEKKVLEEFADEARLFTVIYSVWLYSSTIGWLILSTLPRILTKNGWANITTHILFPIPLHYTDHDEDYYAFIQTWISLGIISILSIFISADGLFVVLIQHAGGLFAAVCYRLEHLVDSEDLDVDINPPRMTDKPFWMVSDCIKKHKAALEFADLLDSNYSWSFLLLSSLNVLSLSFTGLQVLLGANPESLDEAIRQALFGGSQLMHLFFENFFSQRLTDQSLEVYQAIMRSKWYLTSMKTRRLLGIMLMRSMIPWELKAGKMMTMSMANFSSILRTSMSYLTILNSME